VGRRGRSGAIPMAGGPPMATVIARASRIVGEPSGRRAHDATIRCRAPRRGGSHQPASPHFRAAPDWFRFRA
jgi:hypothetical protein